MILRLIYVAGPYRAPTAWLVEQNIRAAETAAYGVLQLGAYPIIPHANTRGYFDGAADAFMLSATLELMRRCDGVLLLNGWSKSDGASKEYDEARRLHIPVFFDLHELADALKLEHWLNRPSPLDNMKAIAELVR